jgi:hypothetical protein
MQPLLFFIIIFTIWKQELEDTLFLIKPKAGTIDHCCLLGRQGSPKDKNKKKWAKKYSKIFPIGLRQGN